MPWAKGGLIGLSALCWVHGCSETRDNAGEDAGAADVVSDRGPDVTGCAGTGSADSATAPHAATLGGTCEANVDCAPGLECMTATSQEWFGKGPARGYCTKRCRDLSECRMFGPRAGCVQMYPVDGASQGYCFEGCTLGSPASADPDVFDPKKCHGREDVACTADFWDNGHTCDVDSDCQYEPVCKTMCGFVICVPSCNQNSDCGSCLHCDRATGRCSSRPSVGKPVGEDCDPLADAATEQCRGFCLRYYGCTEACTIGAAGACGSSDLDGRAPASFCLPALALQGWTRSWVELVDPLAGTSAGDNGLCAALCDCNRDCQNPRHVCRELDARWSARAGH